MTGRTFPAMQAAAATDSAVAARVRHFVYRTREELYDYARDPDALHNPQLPAFERLVAERRM